MKMKTSKVAILGAGNIGLAIMNGLISAGVCQPGNITITRRNTELLLPLKEKGIHVSEDNITAVKKSSIIIISVQPGQLNGLLDEIKDSVKPNIHTIISVVSGATLSAIGKRLPPDAHVVRAMPNTAIAIRESMTCLSSGPGNESALKSAEDIFETLGTTLIINEELMIPATALCACGIAFFLRAIRAASQGGIEIGFHSEEALKMAAQTAKGAASLLLILGDHPESEVDKVTTPRGCTISGLNQMEHSGFSSAMIKGIVTAADKAALLYKNPG
jgi:pyrroline-5-carboxylate reductase